MFFCKDATLPLRVVIIKTALHKIKTNELALFLVNNA